MALDPRSRSDVAAFVRAAGQGVIATVTPDGDPEAALVGLVALEDGTLILNSLTASRKITNLEQRPRAAVVVSDEEVSVQLEGVGTIATGDERRWAAAEYLRHRPGSRDDPAHITFVVVRPSWVRVYDTSVDPPSVLETVW